MGEIVTQHGRVHPLDEKCRNFFDEWKRIFSGFARQLWTLTEITPKKTTWSAGLLLWSSGTCASGLKGNQHMSQLTHNGLDQRWSNGDSSLNSSHSSVQEGPPTTSSSCPMTKVLPGEEIWKLLTTCRRNWGFADWINFKKVNQPMHSYSNAS